MTRSDGRDRKPPPAPVKIYRFEKHTSRPKGAPRREREASTHDHPTLLELPVEPHRGGREVSRHDHPTLPEFSVEPLKGGAAAAPPSLKSRSRHKESAPPARGAPPPLEPRGPDKASSPAARGVSSATAPESRRGDKASESLAGAGLSSGLLNERLATARQLFAQGQLTQARSMLEKLVSLGVGGAPVRTLLGTLYMAQGANERALACFEEALEEDPSDLSARLYRGEVRLGWGDLLLAQEDMDYVLESGTAGSPLVQQARRLLQRIDELRDGKRR
jgi:hypothetical protein